MANYDSNKIVEKIFEVIWYAILIAGSSFFVSRFGGESWSFKYPLTMIAGCILISHFGLSFSQAKEFKLWLRIGLPLITLFIIWYSGDFTLGIINSLQEVFNFTHLIIIFAMIVVSLILTLENQKESSREKLVSPTSSLIKKNSKNFENIIGQDHVIEPLKEIARLAASKIKLGKENSPYAVLLFIGPTGVGKTEAARALAQAVYGSADALIRFDMGQFADAHQASRFYGPPPGYVGYEQGGQLTRAVLKKPRSVILLDEVEKADKKIWDAFLPVFDEGYIVDGSTNQKVDMRQTLIVLTSNLLSDRDDIFSMNGFEVKEAIQSTGAFRPELIGRINEVLLFKSLETKTIREILQRRVDSALWSLAEQGIKLSVEPNQIDAMVLELQAAKFGVRQIDDVLRGHLRKLISANDAPSSTFD